MHPSEPVPAIEAVIFDTDGVVTRTATVHFAAWKQLFDEFLAAHATGDAAAPFTDADYRHHVDGISRYDGVDAMLRSRGIELPWGDPSDAPGVTTVCAVANTKNEAFAETVRRQGVEPYLTTRRFIEALHAAGIRTAVISASRNCGMVLEVAGMADLFEVRVDGIDQAEMGFAGKPAPDVFLEAARRLGVEPSRAAVVEDAISGVAAGRAGGFGLVIGLDRSLNPEPLAAHADLVVPGRGRPRRRGPGQRGPLGAAFGPGALVGDRPPGRAGGPRPAAPDRGPTPRGLLRLRRDAHSDRRPARGREALLLHALDP
ncbi:MAG: beta-phosphoglucomutase family hydrolase [Microthrixaceae bacterium]|nr:beta-phosphoglucomutase family hydrolase [Microthrixaceae bacterium]